MLNRSLALVIVILIVNLVNCQDNLVDCSLEDPTCQQESHRCVKRYVSDISNPLSSGYLNAEIDDEDLQKGIENFKCYPQNVLYTILNKSNKKDEITSVTALYEVVVKSKSEYQVPTINSKNDQLSQVVYASTVQLMSDGFKFINVKEIFWASHAALTQGFDDVYYGDSEKGSFRWFVGIGVITMVSLILLIILLSFMYAMKQLFKCLKCCEADQNELKEDKQVQNQQVQIVKQAPVDQVVVNNNSVENQQDFSEVRPRLVQQNLQQVELSQIADQRSLHQNQGRKYQINSSVADRSIFQPQDFNLRRRQQQQMFKDGPKQNNQLRRAYSVEDDPESARHELLKNRDTVEEDQQVVIQNIYIGEQYMDENPQAVKNLVQNRRATNQRPRNAQNRGQHHQINRLWQ